MVSLDFELMWGMFDKVSKEQYANNILGVRKAVPELLSLFEKENIHATWAVVGMLMCRSKQELLSILPDEYLQPQYENMRVSSYTYIKTADIGKDEKEDPYHFAPSLVQDILSTPYQELASHTFSHFYCIDGKQNAPKIFEADLHTHKKISKTYNVTPRSIIFPRNQPSDTALEACNKNDIATFRGTENHFIYKPRRDDTQSYPIRALRLLDAYLNVTGHNTYTLRLVQNTTPHNIPASRFFRPYSKRLALLEKIRIRRIKDSMTHAAKHSEIFHLWWHPHNFGIFREENLRNLQEIIAHYNILKTEYGMQSKNMEEISETALHADTNSTHGNELPE